MNPQATTTTTDSAAGPDGAAAELPLPRPHTVRTQRLDVSVMEWLPGPAAMPQTQGGDAAPTVFLLHGWPDAPRTWAHLAPAVANAGWRVLVPALRGHGDTRFLSPKTSSAPRSGQLAALAQDLIDLADALGVQRFAVVGHDWGARAAYITACLWPDRVRACVAMSVGWGTNQASQALTYAQTHNYWYHWFLATPRGQLAVRDDRIAFTRYIWDLWCPYWRVSDEEFQRTAEAFANPDWADVVLHSYQHRWGHAPPDETYADLEQRLQTPDLIRVPTLVLHGDDDPVNAASTSVGREALFDAPYRRELIARCGHFPQREHPALVAAHVLNWLKEHGHD